MQRSLVSIYAWLYTYLSIIYAWPYTYLSICLSVYLSIYRSIDLSIYRSISIVYGAMRNEQAHACTRRHRRVRVSAAQPASGSKNGAAGCCRLLRQPAACKRTLRSVLRVGRCEMPPRRPAAMSAAAKNAEKGQAFSRCKTCSQPAPSAPVTSGLPVIAYVSSKTKSPCPHTVFTRSLVH
jgi:hypothetical protein